MPVNIEFISISPNNEFVIEGIAPQGSFVEYGGGRDILYCSADTSRFKIAIEQTQLIDHCVTFLNNQGEHTRVIFDRFSGISNMKGAYRKVGNYIIYRHSYGIKITDYKIKNHIIAECIFLVRIIFNWNYKQAKTKLVQDKKVTHKSLTKFLLFISEAIITIPQTIFFRLSFYILKYFTKKEIWLISDRGLSAGDNGEALFRHVKKVNNPDIKTYFIISRKSPDYERIKMLGKVVNVGGWKHRLLFLCATMIISSHADIETTNPFYRLEERYRDLMSWRFIFLQHGVIRHDHSKWLNRYEKNIKLFITSARDEYNSILNLPYHYKKKNILLSGLPRFDYLRNNSKNKIIVAPTYRAGLLKHKTDTRGARPYDPGFKNSKYFTFYNDFLNDHRILKALEDSNYTIELYLHPNFEKQKSDFKVNKAVTVAEYPYRYSDAISEGSLLVSDYSSIVFDFAYLKKPVIYTKFDEEYFYSTHTYEKSNFFDDVNDGFGVVTVSYEDLVHETIKLLKTDCKMPDVYKNRVDNFFYKIDNNNSKRVYDAIIGI